MDWLMDLDGQQHDKFYITTPIYYVNDKPHIGHAYTTTLCDIMARFHRFSGRDVFFLTGTDEHGVKVEKSAIEKGISPQEQADTNSEAFREVFANLGFTNDDFIRTTEERHVSQVQSFVAKLLDSGDVYLGEYEGWYDEGQEEFVPENRAKENEYKSPINGKPLVRAKEANYFFRLSAFQERLEKLYAEQSGFVRPDARRNEMLGRMRDGLQDVPISRTSFKWGIPIPSDEDHVIYVWVDALFNYATAMGMGESNDASIQNRKDWWPAQYHVVGKEILFFHSILWPALLMALEWPLPKCIYAHSFWIREGRKMSKSLGNFIEVETIMNYINDFGNDAWRWYLATQGPLGATDADFSHHKFIEVYNTDLANTFGNSANRVANMIGKYFDGILPAPSDQYQTEGYDWPTLTSEIVNEVTTRISKLELSHGFSAAMELVRKVDAYIDTTRPFTIAKEPDRREELETILYNCAEALRIASLMLHCVLPWKVESFWEMYDLSIEPNDGEMCRLAVWGQGASGRKITKGAPLFPRHVEDKAK